ncbi:hypothetical protein JZ751_002051 [Albula glossodonta]|uniref:Lysosomal dipeptide transporter MFSD1 n=1 Tax=Albula glossodonta TaxID=121402 RepID=A0A8T2P9D0_9TELE|nr:hypothetical protein JZ751_002051 [Albula glossodonta]
MTLLMHDSIVYIISAPASPVLGFLVDKTGKNIIWVLCAVCSTLAAHMMLAFTFWNPWIAMSLLGVSYSLLACALWPMVAFVVPEHQLGTAYGFMQSIQNLGLALIAMAAGAILDSRGYLFLEVFFSACICCEFHFLSHLSSVWHTSHYSHTTQLMFAVGMGQVSSVVALIAVVMLYFVDFLRGGELNLSASARAKLQKSSTSDSDANAATVLLALCCAGADFLNWFQKAALYISSVSHLPFNHPVPLIIISNEPVRAEQTVLWLTFCHHQPEESPVTHSPATTDSTPSTYTY